MLLEAKANVQAINQREVTIRTVRTESVAAPEQRCCGVAWCCVCCGERHNCCGVVALWRLCLESSPAFSFSTYIPPIKVYLWSFASPSSPPSPPSPLTLWSVSLGNFHAQGTLMVLSWSIVSAVWSSQEFVRVGGLWSLVPEVLFLQRNV